MVDGVQKVAQALVKDRAAFRAAQGIEFQGQVFQAQLGQKRPEHEHDLGVGLWRVRAQNLHIELVELAQTALLRALVAEHGAAGEEFGRPVGRVLAGLDEGAQHAGRGLGAHGQGAALAVGEGVHFLLDHVGFFADGAGEELGLFQDGHAHFLASVRGENLAGQVLHQGVNRALRAEEVRKAFNFLNFRHRKYLSLTNGMGDARLWSGSVLRRRDLRRCAWEN